MLTFLKFPLKSECIPYHYIFTRTLARDSNAHPLVIYAFTIEELCKTRKLNSLCYCLVERKFYDYFPETDLN